MHLYNLVMTAPLITIPEQFAQRAISLAHATLDIEAAAVLDLKARIGAPFAQAVARILALQGRVVVMGMGGALCP